MKIAISKLEASKEAENALAIIRLEGAFIDEGSYKGGLYDCYYILCPLTGEELFSIAY